MQNPYTILTCKTLAVLQLIYLSFNAEFWFYPIRLPSLKTLHLKDIRFQINGHLMLLIDECPILEDLPLYDIYVLGHSREIGKTLKKLNRTDITECRCCIPMETLSNDMN
jgi:hypothetical protein